MYDTKEIICEAGPGEIYGSKWIGNLAGVLAGKPVNSLHFNGALEADFSFLDINSRANKGRKFDICFAAPKSLSVAMLFDREVVAVHQIANDAAVLWLELYAMARIKAGGRYIRIATSSGICAQFLHYTSRAKEPHLHTHNVWLNITTGGAPLDAAGLYKAKESARAIYFSKLAEGLEAIGYMYRLIPDRTGRAHPELHVPESLIYEFSSRRNAIKQKMDEEEFDALSPAARRLYAYYATRDAKAEEKAADHWRAWQRKAIQLGYRKDLKHA
ncbi:MAG: MobF family relaxase [Pseudomonadota bacterium]